MTKGNEFQTISLNGLPVRAPLSGALLSGLDKSFALGGKHRLSLRGRRGRLKSVALSFERRLHARCDLRVLFRDSGQACFVLFDVLVTLWNARVRLGRIGLCSLGICGSSGVGRGRRGRSRRRVAHICGIHRLIRRNRSVGCRASAAERNDRKAKSRCDRQKAFDLHYIYSPHKDIHLQDRLRHRSEDKEHLQLIEKVCR
jgi:hypothetical protein